MKKLLFILCCFMCSFSFRVGIAKAEEIPETSEEITQELSEDGELEKELDKLKAFVSEKLTKENIGRLISYFIEGGTGVGLIVSLLKLAKERKETAKTVEEITTQVVSKLVAEKTGKDQTQILEVVSDLKETTSTIVKALVLMQDSTTKGKLTILDLLSVATDENTHELIKQTKDKVEDLLEAKEEVINGIEEDEEEQKEIVF